MKVLLISNMYPSEADPQYGIFVKNIKEALTASAGLEVFTVVIRGKGRNLGEKIYKYLLFFLQIFVRTLGGSHDIVYVHYPSHSYVPLLLLEPWRYARLVVHVHGSDVLREEHANRLFFALKQFVASMALRAADLIIVPSNYYKHVITNAFQVPKDRVFVYSSGGIDRHIFHKSEGVKREDGFIIGYVGRLDRGKGVGTLVQALDILRDQLPDLKTIIIGKGAIEQKLKTLINEKGLAERVFFLGVMKQSELVSYYNRMDIFVFPTERATESLGLVGLEAMACGVPIIGSKIGGLRDYLQDGYNGFFFEPGNGTDLASKILQFYYLDRLTKSRFSENAISMVQRYDSGLENQRLVKELEDLARSERNLR